jgi:hypothetical protein
MANDDYYDDDDSNDDEMERDEAGRPMLSFPSMEDDAKQKTSSAFWHGNSDDGAERRELDNATSDSDEFFYHPDGFQEDLNQNYAMKKLKAKWGSQTDDRIKTAKWFLNEYADDGYADDLNKNGLGSHPDMISAIYDVAQRLAKENMEQSKNDPKIKMKGMQSITMKKLGEKSREMLNQAIYDAQAKIIKKHGGISR